MRRCALLFLMISVWFDLSLSASEDAALSDIKPLYEKHDFDAVFDRAYPLSLKAGSGSEILYYTAKSAFKTRRYDVAIKIYERLLDEGSSDIEIRLELAIACFYRARFEESESYFKELRAEDLSASIEKIVSQYLDALKQQKQSRAKKLFAVLIGGAGYDDNIRNHPLYELETSAKKKSGAFVHAYLGATYQPMFFERRWLLQADVYDAVFVGSSEENLQYFSLKAGPQLPYANSVLTLPLRYSHMWYGGSAYQNAYGFEPALQSDFGQWHVTSTLQMNYFDYTGDQNRNYTHTGLNVTARHASTHDELLELEFEAALQRASKESSNMSRNIVGIGAGYVKYFRTLVDAGAKYTLRYRDYLDQDFSESYTVYRKETTHYAKLFVRSKPTVFDVVLELRYQYFHNDANIDKYSYRKNRLMLNALYRF